MYKDKIKNKFSKFGNINNRLMSPSKIKRLSVNTLRLMGFSGITYKDVQPSKYKDPAAVKFRKLDDNLNKRSKAMKSSSTADAESIELIEMTSKDIDTTVHDVKQGASFNEAHERDKLLPLREIEGINQQLRTIRIFGSSNCKLY